MSCTYIWRVQGQQYLKLYNRMGNGKTGATGKVSYYNVHIYFFSEIYKMWSLAYPQKFTHGQPFLIITWQRHIESVLLSGSDEDALDSSVGGALRAFINIQCLHGELIHVDIIFTITQYLVERLHD